jgi:RNA polymerase sigma factor (sigma-70 family)
VAIKGEAAVLRGLDALFNVGVIRDLTDGQLLERFSTGRGEAAELAFAALVDRHGPMVLRVCRARLADPHDALDAFQATFLVLIEKARGLWVRDSLGPWLHAVALRTASCARSAAEKRRRAERRAAEGRTEADEPAPTPDPGWERLLHEEIDRLPERYRVPIVLCDLEGNTCEEAARRMGRPVGTVKSWRSRGRDRLRVRLAKAGLVPSIALGAGLARASAPEAQDAIRALLERMTSGAFPASVGMLVKGVRKAMLLKRMGMTAAVVWAAAFVAIGVGAVAGAGGSASDPKGPDEEPRKQTGLAVDGREERPIPPYPVAIVGEAWELSLRDAIRIGLGKAKGVRFVGVEKVDATNKLGLVVTPSDPAMEPHRFKAELMAAIRSIEEAYWGLAPRQVTLWSQQEIVKIAEGIRERQREEMKAGRGDEDELAKVEGWLNELNLQVVDATSSVINAERLFRDVLGLPPADGRRIVPVTEPTESKIDLDWKGCLAAMLENQPNIARARERTKAQRVDFDAIAQSFLPDLLGPAGTLADPPTRKATAGRKATVLEEEIQHATRILDMNLRWVDAIYDQYQFAKKVRTAAQRTLATQRAHYDEGRITIDRCLEAARKFGEALTKEARDKAMYNIAIVALEEAKGTLLEHDEITLAEAPAADSAGAVVGAKASAKDESSPAPAPAGRTTEHAARGKTMAFEATIRVGTIPIEIRGSVTVGPAEADDAEGR